MTGSTSTPPRCGRQWSRSLDHDPDLRHVAIEIGVPRSTLSRIWKAGGAIKISQDNYRRLCRAFGVASSWFTPQAKTELTELKESDNPTASGREFDPEFPYTGKEYRTWGPWPGIRGVFWLARMEAAISRMRDLVPNAGASPQRNRDDPLSPIAKSITQALQLVAESGGANSGAYHSSACRRSWTLGARCGPRPSMPHPRCP